MQSGPCKASFTTTTNEWMQYGSKGTKPLCPKAALLPLLYGWRYQPARVTVAFLKPILTRFLHVKLYGL